jgi:hypothetical protein
VNQSEIPKFVGRFEFNCFRIVKEGIYGMIASCRVEIWPWKLNSVFFMVTEKFGDR